MEQNRGESGNNPISMVNWYSTRVTRPLSGERNLLKECYWDNQTFTCKRMKVDPYLTPYTKINSKWNKDRNVRGKTKKSLKTAQGLSYIWAAKTNRQKNHFTDWAAYKLQTFVSHGSGGWKSAIRVPAWLSEDSVLDLQSSHQTLQRRQWQPTPLLLPGKPHGWQGLVGCSCEESITTEATQQQQHHTLTLY